MDFQHLSPQHLLQAIITGCEHLKEARKKLNEINFFPVADGDTGDNMAATAHAIIENASLEPTVEKTLESVANASILGARGNSGMLFSSFFNGLFQAYQETPHLTTSHFADMLQKAAKQVRSSLIQPMEGTLLTMVENWAKLIQHQAKELPHFKSLSQSILQPLKEVMHQSCQYNHQSGSVLDAGALGFYHFIEGFTQGLSQDSQSLMKPTKSVEDFEVSALDHIFDAEPPKHRFCTEALLRDTHINPNQLQKILQEFGDSIVVTGHQHLQRFHIHTSHPEKVFHCLQSLGRIANPKVDDMQRQYECHLCQSHKLGLLTDSSSDLPLNIRDEYKIHILPINIHLAEHHLLDPYSIDSHAFYQDIKKSLQYPTTSAPNPLQMQNKFRELSQKHEQVIMVTVGDQLSSTYASAFNLAKDYPNFHVINSKLTSAAQSLLVHYAAEQIKANLQDVQSLTEKMQDLSKQISLYVQVHKMDALIRSGRVDKIRGNIANYLHLKPILKLNHEGKGQLYGQALNENKGFQKILDAIEEEAMNKEKLIRNYAIVHAAAPESAQKLAELAEQRFGRAPLYLGPVSAAIGLHAGAGCVGLAVMFDG